MQLLFVYIMASRSRTLYTGITNDLRRRVYEHKEGLVPGFTARYKVTRLVYYETTPNPLAAIAREKQIKAWRREKRIALIESTNPKWEDLSPQALWDSLTSNDVIPSPAAGRKSNLGGGSGRVKPLPDPSSSRHWRDSSG